MSRALIIIRNQTDRERVIDAALRAPFGARVEIKAARRTDEQNKRFWAMLGDISSQIQWHGQWLDAEDWRTLFLDALRRELRLVPSLDNTGFVSLGRSSRDLSIEEMSDCIELMFSFGANHGVIFHDPEITPSHAPAPTRHVTAPAPVAAHHTGAGKISEAV